MSRQLKAILFANILIAVFFCYSNWANWTLLNTELDINSHWSPIMINVEHPNPMVGLIVAFPNYPLILFWLSTIINVYFIIKLQKSKEKNPANSAT